jgi:hypothetical protein
MPDPRAINRNARNAVVCWWYAADSLRHSAGTEQKRTFSLRASAYQLPTIRARPDLLSANPSAALPDSRAGRTHFLRRGSSRAAMV